MSGAWRAHANYPGWSINNQHRKMCGSCGRTGATPLMCSNCGIEGCVVHCLQNDPAFQDRVQRGCWCRRRVTLADQSRLNAQSARYLASINGGPAGPLGQTGSHPASTQAAPAPATNQPAAPPPPPVIRQDIRPGRRVNVESLLTPDPRMVVSSLLTTVPSKGSTAPTSAPAAPVFAAARLDPSSAVQQTRKRDRDTADGVTSATDNGESSNTSPPSKRVHVAASNGTRSPIIITGRSLLHDRPSTDGDATADMPVLNSGPVDGMRPSDQSITPADATHSATHSFAGSTATEVMSPGEVASALDRARSIRPRAGEGGMAVDVLQHGRIPGADETTSADQAGDETVAPINGTTTDLDDDSAETPIDRASGTPADDSADLYTGRSPHS